MGRSFIDIPMGCSYSFLLIQFAQTHMQGMLSLTNLRSTDLCKHLPLHEKKRLFWILRFSQWKVWLDTFLTSVTSQESQLCAAHEVFFKGLIIRKVSSTWQRELHILFYKNYYFFKNESLKSILFSVSESNNLISSGF